jgi:hypothetical protein
MMRIRLLAVLSIASLTTIVSVPSAFALPTMIRLGYAGCASCHYTPQGGGLLTPYGRAVDEAQSLRAGEYRPRDNDLIKTLSWHGRITQDLRLVMPMQRTSTANQPLVDSFRPRLMYRNVTALSRAFAVHATVTGESEATLRPVRSYDPIAKPASLFVNVATLSYHPSPAIEITAGRDQLPNGVNVPDVNAFIKSRNRLGYYDVPTQIKATWIGKRHQVTPFVYGPGGNAAHGERESGGGALAEYDVFGTQRTVVGVSMLHGTAISGDRQSAGIYARLGFGAWGILAEHDITDRTRVAVAESFRQQASYAQVFWAARESLVASAIGERLTVERPFEEHLTSGKVEVAARLTSLAAASAGVKVQRDAITDRVSTSLLFQIALKTVY